VGPSSPSISDYRSPSGKRWRLARGAKRAAAQVLPVRAELLCPGHQLACLLQPFVDRRYVSCAPALQLAMCVLHYGSAGLRAVWLYASNRAALAVIGLLPALQDEASVVERKLSLLVPMPRRLPALHGCCAPQPSKAGDGGNRGDRLLAPEATRRPGVARELAAAARGYRSTWLMHNRQYAFVSWRRFGT
jgi:hypothetical protein